MSRRASTRRALSVLLAALIIATAAPAWVFADDDITPPTGSITIDDGAPYTRVAQVTLGVSATDDASDVVTVFLSNDGEVWETRPFAATIEWALAVSNGQVVETTHTVYARFQDRAGNISESVSDSIVGDHTAPVADVELAWSGDGKASFVLSASDAHGIAGVRFTCESNDPVVRAFATKITVTLATLGCGAVGSNALSVEVLDPAGNSTWDAFTVHVPPTMTLSIPTGLATGDTVTVTPVVSEGFVLPAGAGCRWEFRWGDDASLLHNDFDETFGSLLFDIPAVAGACEPWTFRLPWVPVARFDVRVEGFVIESDGGIAEVLGSDVRRFTATVDSTERRILTSSLPIVQVLPDSYTPVVGRPITYRRYLVGGAVDCCSPEWTAWLGKGDTPVVFTQNGGASFTFTPTKAADLLVSWQRMAGDWRLAAAYDPPVRYPDRSAPSTTTPTHSIGGVNVVAGAVPTTIAWTGHDVGWGIGSYQLQRSIDGAAWHTVVLPRATSTSIALSLSTGHGFRFRVRAIDKAGHDGVWDYGPTFKPWAVQESNPKVTFHSAWKRRADATALGGQLAGSSTAGSWAKVAVTARAVAWVASKGPTAGNATVYVDGKAVATVDLRYASTMPHRVVWSRAWSSVSTHTVKIVVAGTSGRPDVTLDAFLVLA